ncbi:MAG: hypothetical protein WBA02_11245 [Jannaschia helgolandensis]|uniref:Uncharacterized protein n=1 Tax=Jannaschia helgolandensis TaxID=188906 RepID=A0A1H7NZ78_9RHOB|nr:hypothetical protein [Jannaschia helgolandensis]SEL28851.1 hypothetical protein SAMN04488526_2361 [Jannaschia helgolandensis]
MRPLLILALSAGSALAQPVDPEADLDTLDCKATAGGVECAVETMTGDDAENTVLYCLAEDAEGEPLANSTVSTGTGIAVFNSIAPENVDRIAAVTCRTE